MRIFDIHPEKFGKMYSERLYVSLEMRRVRGRSRAYFVLRESNLTGSLFRRTKFLIYEVFENTLTSVFYIIGVLVHYRWKRNFLLYRQMNICGITDISNQWQSPCLCVAL